MINKGVSFGNVHSYNDLDLILSACEIPPAEPKVNYIDLPGGDGSLDLTEAFGEVKYNDREGCQFTFSMNPAGGLTDADFEAKKTEASNALNGKQCKITLDKDTDYYYIGRCTVSEYLSDKRLRQIVVTARVKPWKYKQDETVVRQTLSTTERTITLTNARKTVIPSITCTNDDTKVTFGTFQTTLSAGTHRILDIQLAEGANAVNISGSGTITFTYQEADL